MRIAMLGHKRVPSREGGIEIVVEELAMRMSRRGHEVTCLNRSGHHVAGAEYETREIPEGLQDVKVRDVLTIDKKGIAAITASISGSIIAALGRYDVVHFHAEGPCAMLWLPKLFGKRCVATIHGLDWKREKWKSGLGAKYIRIGERVAAHRADQLIVLSRSAQNYFKETYNRDTVLIPNGTVRPQKRAAERICSKYGLKAGEYLLFVGRLVPEKGISYLIDAYNHLDTEKKLVIAGGTSDTDDYVADLHAKADGNPQIIFTGFVQGPILEELYSNAYLFVLPSDLEGMPLTLMEAMSYGCCCLTSDIPECAEVISDYGMTFAQGDRKDLHQKLQHLCQHPRLVENYQSRAADYICDTYDWEDVVEKTLTVYGKA